MLGSLNPGQEYEKGSPTVEPLNEQRSLLLRCYSLFRKMNPHNSGQNSITLGLETKSTLLSGSKQAGPSQLDGLITSRHRLRRSWLCDGLEANAEHGAPRLKIKALDRAFVLLDDAVARAQTQA
jgi:hypothetical protein